GRAFLGPDDHQFKQVKIQQRFPALKFEREMRRGTRKHEVERLLRRLLGHVVFEAVRSLPGNLAVLARMLAAQRDHEHVQLGESVKEAALGSIFRRQHVEKRRGLVVEHEMASPQAPVKVRARVQFTPYQHTGRPGRGDKILSRLIYENFSLRVERNEPKRQEPVSYRRHAKRTYILKRPCQPRTPRRV